MIDSGPQKLDTAPELVTRYAPMRAVLALVERAAMSEAPVVITGERGTGKRHLASVIHHRSERGGPLVSVDCAAFADRALDVELFGIERVGTGGHAIRKAGVIERTMGGTLVLDGVSVIGHDVQGKLIQAIEHGYFLRNGGRQHVGLGARLVALTSRSLEQAVQHGVFRRELRERLSMVAVELPPLRDRLVDVALLAEHFLGRLGGVHRPMLAPDAVAALELYDWPGNVAELRGVIEQAVRGVRERTIHARDLSLRSPHGAAVAGSAITLNSLERAHIEAVLRQTGWHQGRTVEVLGISPKTLYRRIREYEIERPRSAD